jgi:hypothetical protein
LNVLRRRRVLAALMTVAVVGLVLLVPAALGGGLPSLTFSPTSNDFGTIDSGTTGSKTFTLTNSGGVATAALKVSLTGSAAFSKTADTCTAVSLGPKKSCSVTVQYAPTSAGSNDAGTLTVKSKKPLAVANAALTGKSTAAPTCSAGSETFSGDTVGSQPTTFSGGTIDTAYGDNGGVLSGIAGFTVNSLYSGLSVNSFKLTFTNPVSSVQLNAESDVATISETHLTLNGYDANNVLVDSDTVVDPANLGGSVVPLSILDSGNDIKYFTITTDDAATFGVIFSDIVWDCAA